MAEGFERFFDSEGIWCQTLPGARRGGPALFLDRDGVIVEDAGYLSRAEEAALIPGAAEAIAMANACELAVVVVTNQAGIGRGYYGWRDFAAVQEAILAALAATGARIDAVFACAHHPAGDPPYAHPDHPARKPNPGMLLRAAEALGLDLGRSWLIGDKAIDIEAARAAGLAGAVHVLTGHGAAQRDEAAALAGGGFAVRLCRSIADAPRLIPLLAERKGQPNRPRARSPARRSRWR